MIKKITVLAAFLLVSGCATQKPQVADGAHTVEHHEILEFLIDIQERNFRKSVETCQSRKPQMESAFAQYLTQYRQGAQLALRQIGRRESLNLLPDDREIESFLELQDRQGEDTFQRVSANPAYGCGKLFTIFSVFMTEDAESQLLSNYASYLERRREYCRKVPVPEGCP